jgi:hypothetical protein
MRRSVIVFAVCLTMAVAFGLYRMENQIREMEQRLLETNRALLRSQQAIQVAHAEWSYLNQPARLERLARQNLQLVPLLPSQIGRLEDVPLRDQEMSFEDILDFAPIPHADPNTTAAAKPAAGNKQG